MIKSTSSKYQSCQLCAAKNLKKSWAYTELKWTKPTKSLMHHSGTEARRPNLHDLDQNGYVYNCTGLEGTSVEALIESISAKDPGPQGLMSSNNRNLKWGIHGPALHPILPEVSKLSSLDKVSIPLWLQLVETRLHSCHFGISYIHSRTICVYSTTSTNQLSSPAEMQNGCWTRALWFVSLFNPQIASHLMKPSSWKLTCDSIHSPQPGVTVTLTFHLRFYYGSLPFSWILCDTAVAPGIGLEKELTLGSLWQQPGQCKE